MERTMTSEKENVHIDSDSPSDAGLGSTRECSTDRYLSLRNLTKALSVETGGIQRVTDAERQDPKNTTHVWNACTFWLSANMAVATLSTGMVGPAMGVSFWHCFIVILVVNVLTCLLPAYTATFGLTGLRMTTFSRYSFGYWGNILVVIFSMVATTGWNAINSISGASCFAALAPDTFPTWAGVIIICTTVWIVCVLGIGWIHRLDAFLWIPPFIVWCVAAGTGAKHLSSHAIRTAKGEQGAASVLSFIAVIFSFGVSWINCAADYNVKMPSNTPRWKIFVATYIGIFIPSFLVQTLGAALYTGTKLDPSWGQAYAQVGVGGPLMKALEPAGGFGKFLVVLAGLSAIPNNIPNNYSFAMHAQNFGPWAIRVPRIVFVTCGFIAAIVVGCTAARWFHDSLQTFLSIIGYWTIIHLVIVMQEHFIFRDGLWKRYNFEDWNDVTKLPFGWAAIGAFCFGFIGAALGMKVAWYVAPIAGLIGKGANIGHELTFAFSSLAFPPLRWMEKKYTGR